MSRIHTSGRVVRNALLSAAVAGAGLTGLLGATAGAAHASVTKPDGYVTTITCGALAGTATYSPGLLTSTAQATTATVKADVSNCFSDGQGQFAGFGTLTAQLTGSASEGAESFGSGTFTINWPSPLEPSSGTLSVVDNNGVEEISGSITSGPYTGGELNVDYVITTTKGTGTTAKPVKSQTFINNTSLTVMENDG
jgi:hypothetical protein